MAYLISLLLQGNNSQLKRNYFTDGILILILNIVGVKKNQRLSLFEQIVNKRSLK